ncbi:peptide deformylase [Halothermothrix orenii]|uniref:Peptide deformylase n=1 Tax=Halothermothrix orenii (strain H 168 / OCM 544 / DSM 9562) TaxID=373903 RepID=DEF_HALOH|nr:peptide deformylase [Halothermothrix orenii]B8CWS6.1 RecName: Full=Peptide deformylase; Short=PDF; AltName: Full=Polypeptide deformylase [Halothermothrix orenii H 168]ACL69745.1 peptide deformylase [Halothermothrix orenii H 168]
MPVLQIRKIGDPVLRSKAKPVTEITKKTLSLIDNMVETMYQAEGVGLAAPQVGVSKRIIVVDTGEGQGLIELINPEIIETEGKDIMEEGCLSVPGQTGKVIRASKVTVKGLNRGGKEVRIRAEGFLARAFQHEIDHLNGILFIDKVVRIGEEMI